VTTKYLKQRARVYRPIYMCW